MLPARHRLRRSQDFALAVRRGTRAGRRHLVVHLHRPPAADVSAAAAPPLVGFVVPRSVGGSVQRHRVARRLRPLAAAHLPELPAGSLLVVRATPEAAGAPSAALAEDLRSALAAVLRRSSAAGPAAAAPAAGGRR